MGRVGRRGPAWPAGDVRSGKPTNYTRRRTVSYPYHAPPHAAGRPARPGTYEEYVCREWDDDTYVQKRIDCCCTTTCTR